MTTVKVKFLDAKTKGVFKATEGSAGFDLYVLGDYRVEPNKQATMIRTGISLAIPKGYHGKVYMRSSTGVKTKLRLANGTGIIDSDYRGEVMIPTENIGDKAIDVHNGVSIAQILIEKNAEVTFQVVDTLDMTKRGTGGFGSTGSCIEDRQA